MTHDNTDNTDNTGGIDSANETAVGEKEFEFYSLPKMIEVAANDGYANPYLALSAIKKKFKENMDAVGLPSGFEDDDLGPRTYDEYALEEREHLVGMWAMYGHRGGFGKPEYLIIEGVRNEAGRVPCYKPDAPTPHAWAPDPYELVPLIDCPRAWTVDGKPPFAK